jgi:hypothetical protein
LKKFCAVTVREKSNLLFGPLDFIPFFNAVFSLEKHDFFGKSTMQLGHVKL